MHPVFSSKRFCKYCNGYCNKSPITLQFKDSVTICPNLPPRFLTFFIGNIEYNVNTAAAGNIVCRFGLCNPHANLANI